MMGSGKEYAMGGKAGAFKPCAECPNEMKCKKMGKCMMADKGPKRNYAKGGKVRGAGMAKKGVRPCKMR